MSHETATKTAVVFAGGLSLAAYHAGAYETLDEHGVLPAWVAGSSAGAVTAALIAGNRPEDRMSRLRSFWNLGGGDAVVDHPWEHLQGWVSAMTAHVFGRVGYFHPRLPSLDPLQFRSLYDLAPMRQRLERLIDFGRLNSGDVRISIAATDVESGNPVSFDSIDGPIGMDHLMASCGFLPEFAPVTIDGRLLADGGFSVNAPFDPILEADETFRLFVVDLFSRDGDRPRSMEAALERKNDLMFGNQTFLRLKDKLEIRSLKRRLAGLPQEISDQVFLLSYRAGPEEPGPEKSFNFSSQGLATRWRSGRADMLQAVNESAAGLAGLRVIRRPADRTSATAQPMLRAG